MMMLLTFSCQNQSISSSQIADLILQSNLKIWNFLTTMQNISRDIIQITRQVRESPNQLVCISYDLRIEFYEMSMPRPITNLIPTDPYPIIQKRERRIIKMMINKEKQLEQRERRIDDTIQESNQLLYDMDEEINSEEDSSSEDDKKSYDSSLHDIYEEFIGDDIGEKYEGIIQSQSIKKSDLIMDFKGEPKPKEKIAREIIKQRKEMKEQKSKNFINESEDYRQETLPINMKPTKSRKSFMEYYYSISPQKTNILNSLYKF